MKKNLYVTRGRQDCLRESFLAKLTEPKLCCKNSTAPFLYVIYHSGKMCLNFVRILKSILRNLKRNVKLKKLWYNTAIEEGKDTIYL